MRNYSTVSPQFWIGETGQQLRKDADAQRLALYLMTCPNSNMIGLYYLPIPVICHELGMMEKRVRELLSVESGCPSEGASKGHRRGILSQFCSYDGAFEVIFVVEMARFQCGPTISAKDKRKPALKALLNQHRKCRLYKDFHERYGADYGLEMELENKPLRRGIEGACNVRPQDQEQEQKQEQEQESSFAEPSKATSSAGMFPTGPEEVAKVVKPKKAAKTPKEKLEPAPRPRNLLFDAVADVCGLDPSICGSLIGGVSTDLAGADVPYTADDVHEFARRFWELCSWAKKDGRTRPSPTEVRKYISQIRAAPATPDVPQNPNQQQSFMSRGEREDEYFYRMGRQVAANIAQGELDEQSNHAAPRVVTVEPAAIGPGTG